MSAGAGTHRLDCPLHGFECGQAFSANPNTNSCDLGEPQFAVRSPVTFGPPDVSHSTRPDRRVLPDSSPTSFFRSCWSANRGAAPFAEPRLTACTSADPHSSAP